MPAPSNHPRRIVIHHLSGCKAEQIEAFPTEHFDILTFGRSRSVDVHYDAEQHEFVSRRHAAITRDGDGYTLIDLGSRNGTFLNDEPVIRPRSIRPGDTVKLSPVGPAFIFGLDPPAHRRSGFATAPLLPGLD